MAYVNVTKLIPASLYALKAPYAMKPEFITIHNTANDATAANEIAYMTRNTEVTSFHVAIDDKQAIQAIPFDRNAWHAGDGKLGAGNRKSIGIEICYSKSGGQRYAVAEANAIEYIAQLLKQRGWTIANVKWHRDWSGKNCPHRIFAEGRADAVRKAIADRLAQLSKPVQVAYVDAPKPAKEADEMQFTSGTLRREWETFLGSKAQREIAVRAAVEAGYSETWIKKLAEGNAADGDIAALAVGALIRANKT